MEAYVQEEFFDERNGWNMAKVEIPLHNYGRVFFRVGKKYIVSASFKEGR
ncbi:MAG: hypothetical protein ABWK01_09655 [Infirmifilum sp.]